MTPIARQMQEIRTGRRTQFAPLIQILAAQLATGNELPVRLPQLMSNLWLPRNYVNGGVLKANPAGLVLGIRINSQSALQLPWGLQGDYVTTFTGAVEQIFVQLLSGAAADVVLHGAVGVGLSYSGALQADGTPPASPSIGGSIGE